MKRIINVMGPSSAGKTTLFNVLEKDQCWITVSGDEVADKQRRDFFESLKQPIIEKIKSLGLYETLQKLMSDEEILTFFLQNKLTLKRGEKVYQHQFISPRLPGLKDILADWGFDLALQEVLEKSARAAEEIIARHHLPFEEVLGLIHDEAFRRLEAAPDGATIIVDVVPLINDDSQGYLDRFKQKAEQYRLMHADEVIEDYNVLAICSPATISERMESRNRKAGEDNNPVDKREGLFPLLQLAEVVTVQDMAESSQQASLVESELSKDELFSIVKKNHIIPAYADPKAHALVLENPVDPAALDFTAEETFVRIGTQSMVKEFTRLTQKIGLFGERGRLIQRPQLNVDATINMVSGSSQQIAGQLVEQIEKLSAMNTSSCVLSV